MHLALANKSKQVFLNDALLPLSFKVVLTDFALITYAVPAERIRARLPSRMRGFQLETFEGKGFISMGIFFNRGFHWAMAGRPRLNFYQCTYRTYLRRKGQPCAFFFRTDLQTWSSYVAERLIARIARHSTFDVHIERKLEGYERYSCEIESDDITRVALRAVDLPVAKPPFTSGEQLAQFFMLRPHGIFPTSLGRFADQFVVHRPVYPYAGELFVSRMPFWEKLGLLTPREMNEPYSVLVQPSVEFTIYPPIPMGFIGALA